MGPFFKKKFCKKLNRLYSTRGGDGLGSLGPVFNFRTCNFGQLLKYDLAGNQLTCAAVSGVWQTSARHQGA